MKQNKKRIGGLFASLCTAALLLGGVPSFAERTSGGECTGPTVDNDCSCTNTVQCSDKRGWESGGGGISWEKVLKFLKEIFS
jgi:hypothetical protein